MSDYNTLLDYVNWRGDLDFKTSPFNDIDAMVLCQLSSIDFRGIDLLPHADHVEELSPCSKRPTLAQLSLAYQSANYEKYENNTGEAEDYLLVAVGKSNRFGQITADGYINDIDESKIKQFSAITFFLGKRLSFIAFRGTDDTIVSWRENLCMSHTFPVPSQQDAAKYLATMSKGFFNKIMVGGHSKGGNLAVYASTFNSYKITRKILDIYAFDSPGYKVDISREDSFQLIKDSIHSYTPTCSIIGTILNPPFLPVMVESLGEGVNQHHMFSWKIQGTALVRASEREKLSIKLDEYINNELLAVPDEEKPACIDEIFDILGQFNIHSLGDFSKLDFKNAFLLVTKAVGISSQTRGILMNLIKIVLSEKLHK